MYGVKGDRKGHGLQPLQQQNQQRKKNCGVKVFLYVALGILIINVLTIVIVALRYTVSANAGDDVPANVVAGVGNGTAGLEKVVESTPNKGPQICTEVDVVYTWVNGTDPEHKALLKKYGKSWDGGYREYGVLKYSIRTVEKYMPWARNIVIVTNGQVPTWANTSSPRLRIVTHKEIFPNAEADLPTFNSNAIEAHLHNIPGLAPCYLYLNDDMFLGAPIPKDLFFDKHGNLNLHMSGGYIAPMEKKMKKNLWHRSVGHTNDLINSYYYPNAKTVVKHKWKDAFDLTSTHKFREGDDTALPFMHANVALEEFGAQIKSIKNIYGTWSPSHSSNMEFWDKIWDKGNYCVCMNDRLDNTRASENEIKILEKLFESKFPEPSSIELRL